MIYLTISDFSLVHAIWIAILPLWSLSDRRCLIWMRFAGFFIKTELIWEIFNPFRDYLVESYLWFLISD